MFDKLIRAHKGQDRSVSEQEDYARDLAAWVGFNNDRVWHIGDDRGVVNTHLQARWPKARIDTMDPSAGTGMLEDGAPGGPYDLILLPRTVEHLIDLDRCRRIIVDALKSGGRFFVDTLIHEWAGMDAVKCDHPWIFSAATVLRLWTDGGLRLDAVERRGNHLWTLWLR